MKRKGCFLQVYVGDTLLFMTGYCCLMLDSPGDMCEHIFD